MFALALIVAVFATVGAVEKLANLRGPNVQKQETKIHSSQESKVRQQEKRLDQFLESLRVNVEDIVKNSTQRHTSSTSKQTDLNYAGGKPRLTYPEGFIISRRWANGECTGPGTEENNHDSLYSFRCFTHILLFDVVVSVVGRPACVNYPMRNQSYLYTCNDDATNTYDNTPRMRVEYFNQRDCVGTSSSHWYQQSLSKCEYGESYTCLKRDGPAGLVQKHDGLMT